MVLGAGGGGGGGGGSGVQHNYKIRLLTFKKKFKEDSLAHDHASFLLLVR